MSSDEVSKTSDAKAVIPPKAECAGETCAAAATAGEQSPAAGPKKVSPFLTKSHSSAAKPAPAPGSEIDVEEEQRRSENIIKQQYKKIDEEVKDHSIFNEVCQLYFISDRTKSFATRGAGKMIIMKDDSGLYRVVMYRDGSMLKGCDHYVGASCKLSKLTQVKKTWAWVALEDRNGTGEVVPKITYAATFKTDELFELYGKKYEEAREANAALFKSGNVKKAK